MCPASPKKLKNSFFRAKMFRGYVYLCRGMGAGMKARLVLSIFIQPHLIVETKDKDLLKELIDQGVDPGQ